MTIRTYGNGAWQGELRLVLLEDKRRAATRAGRSLWAVESPLDYRAHDGDTITLPPGMVTDLASIPRWAWSLLPPDGPWTLAAVFHDYLYKTRGIGGLYSRAECDRILLWAMEDLEVPRAQRLVIWAAVRLGGAAGWGS